MKYIDKIDYLGHEQMADDYEIVKGGRDGDTYAYEKRVSDGRLFLRLKTMRGVWSRRRQQADPKGNRLPEALRRLIRREAVPPPDGWEYRRDTGRIMPYDSDKIIFRRLNLETARRHGFATRKEMVNLIAAQAKLGRDITTFSGLKKAKKSVSSRLTVDSAGALRSALEKKKVEQQDIKRVRVLSQSEHKKLRLKRNVYQLDLDRDVSTNDVPHIYNLVREMVEMTIRGERLKPRDKLQVIFESVTFTKLKGGEYITAYKPVSEADDLVKNAIEGISAIITSAEEVKDLKVIVSSVETAVVGRGFSRAPVGEFGGVFHTKVNTHCGPTALVLCKPIAKLMGLDANLYKERRETARRKAALALMETCGIDKEKEYFEMEDFEVVSEKFNVCVHIYDVDQKAWLSTSNKTKVPNDDDHHVYLIQHRNHYDCIYKLKTFFRRSYVCHIHEHGYHSGGCSKCKKASPEVRQQQAKATSNLKCCPFCKKKRDGKYHRCCRNCLEDISKNGHQHQCYMTRGYFKAFESEDKVVDGGKVVRKCGDGRVIVEYNNLKSSELYIDFDFETMTVGDDHVVNKAVAKYFSGEVKEFSNLDDFMAWVLTHDKVKDSKGRTKVIYKHKGYTFRAHYGSGFDFQPIYKWFYEHNVNPHTIHSGCKITTMTVQEVGIRFIDTYKFFLCPLEALPKMFGITEEKKGFFPHKFNIPENQTYVGPMPDISFYDPDCMKTGRRLEFLKWYETQKDCVFDFQRELSDYCHSDVSVLSEACRRLREMFMESDGIDPFQYTTIPATTLALFRANHMPENTIAVFDNANDNHSAVSMEWLKYMEVVQGHSIHTAEDGREAWVIVDRDGEEKSKKVDGYYDNNVYEFSGCYYHGCPKCFPERSSQYQKTMQHNEEIRQGRYVLHHIWECEWKAMKEDDDVSAIVSVVSNDLSINPRDAFFGGRTDALKTFFDIRRAPTRVKIYYKDITSLYPYVNYSKAYPVGHPTVIKNDFDYSLTSYFGLVKCKVQPPTNLYHPVLPRRIGSKLVFDLGGDNNETFVGTWTTMELVKALEKGYKIEEIYEVWNFEKQTGSIFKSYVGQFLKTKQEASGFPSWVETEEDKDKYIADYNTNMGIMMDKDKIEKNDGLRSFAKLCLNNLWGRFGMRSFNNERQFVRSYQDIIDIFNDDRIQQDTVNLALVEGVEDHAIATYNLITEKMVSKFDTNIFIAIFTTSWARLELYKALEILGERVLYMDTDSVIYYHEDEEGHGLPEGDLLGQFTDELDGHYIEQWVSGGPKNYGYKLGCCDSNDKKCKNCCSDGTCQKKKCLKCNNTVCKVKGFSLCHSVSQKINFDSVKTAVEKACRDGESVGIDTEMFRIRYNKKTMNLQSKMEPKQWKYCLEKRKVSSVSSYCIDTVPFGHERLRAQ